MEVNALLKGILIVLDELVLNDFLEYIHSSCGDWVALDKLSVKKEKNKLVLVIH